VKRPIFKRNHLLLLYLREIDGRFGVRACLTIGLLHKIEEKSGDIGRLTSVKGLNGHTTVGLALPHHCAYEPQIGSRKGPAK
jgi:hypothetical protein